MKGSRFDLEAYLTKLKWDRHNNTKQRHQNVSKNRYCIYSKDPVQDDLIWRSVVRGESSAAQRRELDYAHAQDLIHKSCSSRPRSPYGQSTNSSSSDRTRRRGSNTVDDLSLRRQRYYSHATSGPPVPETSSRYIGWRSSVPELRLERYNTYK